MATKMYHVFSTAANDNVFHDWVPGPNEFPVSRKAVTIKGGAGVITKALITPLGAHTQLNEEEMAICEKDGTFQQMKRNGFITVQSRNMPVEKAAADMDGGDQSKPLTPSDFDKSGMKVKVGAPE